jgi:hypothetical protein
MSIQQYQTLIFRARILVDGVVKNISDATTKEIKFKSPDGRNLVKTASFTTDGTDGNIQYKTTSGDLNISGTWKWQPHVVTPTDNWYGNLSTFNVGKII